MSKVSEIDATFAPDLSFRPTDREAQFLALIDRRMAGLVRRVNQRLVQVDQELDIGNPGLDAVEAVRGNLAGAWVSLSITAGAGTTVVFTHNLNLPVVAVVGRAYNQCNVTWLARFIFGDRTGVVGAPAAGAATAHSSLYFRLGDSVTANAIELRVQTDLAIGAAAPLNIDARFFPAIV